MEELQEIEEDAGLGNGGLGRLAGEPPGEGPSLGAPALPTGRGRWDFGHPRGELEKPFSQVLEGS